MQTRFCDLTLVLTERCNLSCSYCYVPKRAREMPLETALAGVDWLLGQAPPGRDCSVSFFGGEPLLAEPALSAIIAHGRERRRSGLRFMTPTNGTLLDEPRLARLQAAGLELALSVDEAGAPGEVRGKTLAALDPAALAGLRRTGPIVRMTVTPQNVGSLCESVIAIFGAGFSRIMHQPALETPWPDEAVEVWCSEHRRLADWLLERTQSRQPIPELMTLEGISRRLQGAALRPCGAGTTNAALDAEGRLFGCYRSVFDPRPDRVQLGDLRRGFLNEPLLAAYARLDASRIVPEEGSCARCEARDGCTIYCPAMGHALLGDLQAVPALACRLVRVQVEICRDTLAQLRRFDQSRRSRIAAHVAAAALALGLSASLASCERAPVPGTQLDSRLPGGNCDGWSPRPDYPGPGVCPVGLDYRREYRESDYPAPGLCDRGWYPDQPPGLCPIKLDGIIGPGLCVQIPDTGIGPGLCVVKPDGPIGGLC
jgi:radical SAM protein with 4Fe4S-binding SPASM domain